MNSNPSNYSRFPSNFRETFGIMASNGKQYKDIKKSFLLLKRISLKDIQTGWMREPTEKNHFLYIIHCDFKTYHKIIEDGETDCIISYQQRTTGNFAMIRLFEKELQNATA